MERKRISFEGKLHILAAIVLVLSSIMTWMGYGQDIEFHAERLAAIAAEMKNGPGIYRIYTTVCEGYGYASPMFYGDIFMYPAAALVALGVPLGIAFRLFLASILVFSYLTMYLCAKAVWGKKIGVMAAYLYAFSPILLEDIFIRYAVGEAMAFVFIPVVLYGFYRIVIEPKNPKIDWIFLALGMSGLIFSHIISTVLTAILLVLLCLFFVKKIRANKKNILYIIYAALLTVALTAYFTLPMLEQMATSKFYVVNRQTSNLAGNVAPLIGLLFGSEYMSVLNVILEKITGISDYFSFSWFPGGFGYLLFFVLFLRLRKKGELKDKKADVLLGWSLFYLVISTVPFIQPLLEPLVGFIKIPWRNLTFYILFLALGAAILFAKLRERQMEKIYRAGMLTATFGTLVAFLGLVMITLHNGMFPFETLSTTSIGLGEYLPSAVSHYDYSLERGDEVRCSDDEVVFTFERGNGYSELSYEGVDGEVTFEVPVYMYLGYDAVNEETGVSYEPAISENGLVEFTVRDSWSGTVKIYYKGTLLQKVSVWISFATVVMLVAVWWYTLRERSGAEDRRL
ncbi:MAG: hypothetical protein J6C37_01190 [Roseburia sp.]|nr:hypothetical protein [Roseburia sp.]